MKLGVAIPAYIRDVQNGRLEKCLDSIEAQTRVPDVVSISISSFPHAIIELKPRPFEVICSISNDPQNAAKNRNIAASKIADRCDLILFMDGDDTMIPVRTEFIERAFLETDCDFLLHNYVFQYSPHVPGKPTMLDYNILENVIYPDPREFKGVCMDNFPREGICTGHISVRSSVFAAEKQNEDLTERWEDAEFAKRLLNKNYKAVYCTAHLSIYHIYR
jgi:glycosyltransferase involved in cell wall biosynthesis